MKELLDLAGYIVEGVDEVGTDIEKGKGDEGHDP